MCGIAGVWRSDGAPADAAVVARMLDVLGHRGPDGRGAWAEGPVALGHVRLAIRDRGPTGAQPVVDPGGAGVLVYNGEVYDDAALRRDLEREGAVFRGTGDAEVVCAALARWGPEATLPRLDGMFAFAWWDARARALWLARDRFGIKPLHVALRDDRLLFASEIRALRTQPGVGERPDPVELLRRYLLFRVDDDRSPFEGVESVPAGGLWRASGGSIERRRWFDLVRDLDVARIVAAERERPEAFVDRVDRAIGDAVRSHLVSDVPVATFLSGGVDSGLVTAFARRDLPRLVAYTIDTCDPKSEVAQAARTAAHLGVELRPVRVDRAAHLRLWPESVAAIEHPTLHASSAEALALCRAAAADGVKVVLTGEGSDELFGGYGFVQKTWRRWREVEGPLGRWRRRHRDALSPRAMRETPFAYQAARREPELHLRLAAALVPEEETRAWALVERLAPLRRAADRAFLAHGVDALPRHLGRILTRHDRTGMAASIEARVPFLGTVVSDVGLHLPRRAKFHRGLGKWAVRRAALRRLPREVALGEKLGFPVPESHHAGLSELLRGGAVAEHFRWSGAATEALLPRIDRDPILRHHLGSLEIWLRVFFHGEPAGALGERLLRAARLS